MCSALLYSVFGVIIEKARGAEDDLNTIAAGTLAGVLYKSPGRSDVYHIVLSLRSKKKTPLVSRLKQCYVLPFLWKTSLRRKGKLFKLMTKKAFCFQKIFYITQLQMLIYNA